jgi:thiamine transport system substrate-binding protein
MHIKFKNIAAVVAVAALLTTTLTACSALADYSRELTIVTHDSAVFSKAQLAEFKKETGITVKQVKAGDAGAMTNKLVLTKNQPIGDLVYGIDNTFAGVATDNKIIDGDLRPIDFGDVCMNYDKLWFAKNETPAPKSINDLTKPDFKNLTVIENPTTSSTGLAFLAATVSVFGANGWEQYWRALKANGVKVAAGWEDAYYTDFSGSSGKGAYPIVLSYSSSPADEVRDNGESQTAALLDACYRQTEYAGVLKNAKNKAGAAKFIDYMLTPAFQKTLPTSMYVYPVLAGVKLPTEWARFATVSDNPVGGELNVNVSRKDWLTKWSAIFSEN